ncbi:MAG: PqqD family protein [Gemmatimonadales bacterium]
MQQETILFDPGSNRFCLLNGTAAFLWEKLGEPATVDQLSAHVCQAYEGVDKTTASKDVTKALEELSALAIIEPVP